MADIEYRIIDNLNQINSLWETLGLSCISEDWKFILEWNDLTIDQKHKKYC